MIFRTSAPRRRRARIAGVAAGAACLLACLLPQSITKPVEASSHREAPNITTQPKCDGTDFYMFQSYDDSFPVKGSTVLIANYQPLQLPDGGPNYFAMDPRAAYQIHIDNDGDGIEDITFRFRFQNQPQNKTVTTPTGDREIPLLFTGPVDEREDENLNIIERYTCEVYLGPVDTVTPTQIIPLGGGDFIKPADNAGAKTFPDYEGYAAQHIFQFELPDMSIGTCFVAQRADPFFVNLGEVFDLLNIENPVGEENANRVRNTLDGFNVTSFILELPTDFLVDTDPVIGAWTTCLFDTGDITFPLSQVSRLGNPLVNELIIGLNQKDQFNASSPSSDSAFFFPFFDGPTLPELMELILGTETFTAPDVQRDDLVAIFLTGLNGLNQPTSVTPAEMLRLNTSIPSLMSSQQNPLGVLGGDNAGFPNGRRPGDDVVDIALRAMAGVLLPPQDAPSGSLELVDGVRKDATNFYGHFPYLLMPHPGSPGEGVQPPMQSSILVR